MSQTKPGTRRLSDVARHVVVPEGITTTGYPAVEAKCRDMGIVHDDWQQALGRLVLGKRRDGKYAATVGGVVMSIPRQVGKTFTVGSIIFALCILFPRLTVLWTAHHTRTSDETFGAMLSISNRSKVAPHLAARRRANGQQEIRFRNGSRIMFGAREQGFGRGFAEVDVEVFDEAQILNESALEDMVAATNQAKHPAGALLFYMGTPPRAKDPGEVFRNKRAKALAGASKDTVYVELSADPDADPDDRGQWSKANPSYPVRTPLESMQRLRENVGSDESFLREGLGVWDETVNSSVVDLSRWVHAADVKAQPRKPLVFGVDLGEDRTASIGAAWRRPGGLQVMLGVAPDGRLDVGLSTAAVVERLVELCERWSGRVVLGGPATALELDLRRRGVLVSVLSGSDFAAACGQVADRVADGSLFHGNQEELNDSVRGARWRTVGSAGERAWQLKGAVGISPLAAVTRAAAAALARPEQVLEPVAVPAPLESSGLSSMQF